MRKSAVLLAVLLIAIAAPVRADKILSAFEPPVYSIGTVNGQDGWSSTGPYDEGIVDVSGLAIPGWGQQAFRISNNVTSGSFGDQTFSKPTLNEAGETDAVNGGMSGGVRVRRFDARFELRSVLETWQPGLAIEVSPDRGDGARMSLLRISDEPGGMRLELTDYRTGFVAPGCATSNFVTTQVANGLSRFQAHKIRMVFDFVDGTANDVVKVYVNNQLRLTGTTWEDFFRECQAPGSRTVDSLLFRATGDRCSPTCNNRGFLFDNVSSHVLGAVVDTLGGVAVAEGGGPDSYTIKLESQPADIVRVDLFPDPGISVSPPVLFFRPSDFFMPQTVTVTAVQDAEPEPTATLRIQHNLTSLDGTFDGTPADIVPVTVTDDDGHFVLRQTEGSTITAEWGPFDHYQMHLLFAPTSDVTVTAIPDADLAVTPSVMTFTPLNWNMPQTIKVSAVDDNDVEGEHFGVVTHTSASADPLFDAQPVPSLSVKILDNDPNLPPSAPTIDCPGTIPTKSHLFTGTSDLSTAVEVWLNGVLHSSDITDSSGRWEAPVSFPNAGSHTITARAVNISNTFGPFSAPCVVTVTADFTPPPAPAILTPAQNAVTPAQTTVSGTAGGDAAMVRLFDGGIEIAQIPVTSGSWSSSRFFTTGVHVLTAKAEDASGNVSVVSASRTFTADGENPKVTIFVPPGGNSIIQPVAPFGSYGFRGNASDGLAGMQRLEATYEELFTGRIATSTPTCSGCPSAGGQTVTWTDSPGLLPGIYLATVRGYDRVGNRGEDSRFILFVG